VITLGSASASAKDHADWALEFIEGVNAEQNEWSTPCSINWGDGTPGSMSGTTKGACFFTLSLMKAGGYSTLDTHAWWDINSPGSDDYYEIINGSPALGAPPPGIETYFRRVTRALDIQKGDVLVVDEKIVCHMEVVEGVEVEVCETLAGHTAIITGAPVDITSRGINPRYSGTRQYAVEVADSTATAHGCSAEFRDSRWIDASCTNYKPGAGTATMRLYTDSLTGILLGYTWSVTSSLKSYMSPMTRPYRIGRLFKLPEPIDPSDPPPPP
jgi:hypothetical protein